MATVLVTGSSGLVGSACVRHFHAWGWEVHGIDKNFRQEFFGTDGDTSLISHHLRQELGNFYHHWEDIREAKSVNEIIILTKPDLIIHAAAQPSHDYAASHPFEDFAINAGGTLNLLEAVRRHAPEAVFCFLSTNKVYGDAVNRMAFEELPTRYELTGMGTGVGEWLPIDQSTHSLFGCSKLAADLYVQEYGRNFGLKTVCFRCGCLTGGDHAGAEQHGFLAYLVRCCREGRKYKVYGYGGKQVRDNLHAHDVALACEQFYQDPRAGEVYNLGGGRKNSLSVLEAIQEIETRLGSKLDWEYIDQPRTGDHKWWITDTTKFRTHYQGWTNYPGWSVTRDLDSILDELCQEKVAV